MHVEAEVIEIIWIQMVHKVEKKEKGIIENW